MMYVFICPKCKATRMVSLLRKLDCQCCSSPMANCELDYMEWINLTPKQRQKMIDLYHNADPVQLFLKYREANNNRTKNNINILINIQKLYFIFVISFIRMKYKT